MSVFLPESHCFDYRSFVVGFEIREFEPSDFVLIQDCSGRSGRPAISYEGCLFHFGEGGGHGNLGTHCTEFIDGFRIVLTYF